ncbi:MAG: KdsC family phosphatase [Flavisolibacter sp.]|jgi:3-deoxy-D-manno-octulosonate 8-phosphate phosphatase (KDO 8-P phosphatase)
MQQNLNKENVDLNSLSQAEAGDNVLQYFQAITTFIFDVDGVLTNGSVLLLENGLQARQMNIKDGLGLQMAIKNGYRVVIISGAASGPVSNRFQYLGITEVHLGVKDKLAFLQSFAEQNNLSWKEILFMGDDLPDLAVLEKVGLSCCPADAAAEVKAISKFISAAKGGGGCVREVIEKVLKLNDRWNYNTDISSR